MAKLQVPFSRIFPDDEVYGGHWSGVLKDCELQVLGYELLIRDSDGDIGCVELSQSMGRAQTSKRGSVPAIIPKSKIWLLPGVVDTVPLPGTLSHSL